MYIIIHVSIIYTLPPLPPSPPPSPELEALGDDFLGEDEDTSYLDAVAAPDPPTGIPGSDTSRSRVQVRGGEACGIYMYM